MFEPLFFPDPQPGAGTGLTIGLLVGAVVLGLIFYFFGGV